MFLDKNKAEELILELGLVNRKDFDLAAQEAIEKNIEVCDILIRKGNISENEWREIQMKVAGISFVDLKKQEIEPDILTIIPEPIVRQYGVVAFGRDGKSLQVAVLDLNNLEKIDFLKKRVGLRIKPWLTDQASVNNALLRYQELLWNEYGATIQKRFSSFQTLEEDSLKELPREAVLELARSKQINAAFELLLEHALGQGASYIHIEPRRDNVLIRYRIEGDLCSAMVLPKKSAFILSLKIKVLAGMKLDASSTETCQDGRFHLSFDGKDVEFRAHIIPAFWGERIVLNILREGDSGFSLEAAGFHGRGLDILYKAINKKEKMLLIAGPSRSGRTTTFYTILDLLKNPRLSVATIENTIEFQMRGINQTVIKPEIGFGVSSGTERLLKQDFDIIAADEAGDLNSVSGGNALSKLFDAVNENRFVISVVETDENSTARIIFKMMSAKRLNLIAITAGLELLILQKLTPKFVGEKQEYYLNVSEIKKISKGADLEKVMKALVDENILDKEIPWSKVKFVKSLGGNKSNEKIMLNEVLKISPRIKELIMKKMPVEKIEEQARREGMLTLTEDLVFRAVQGLISVDEIL